MDGVSIHSSLLSSLDGNRNGLSRGRSLTTVVFSVVVVVEERWEWWTCLRWMWQAPDHYRLMRDYGKWREWRESVGNWESGHSPPLFTTCNFILSAWVVHNPPASLAIPSADPVDVAEMEKFTCDPLNSIFLNFVLSGFSVMFHRIFKNWLSFWVRCACVIILTKNSQIK